MSGTFRRRLELETYSYGNGKRGVFTYPWPHMVTSAPPALPPQLLETLGWTLLSHSVRISLLVEGKILALLWPRENGRAPEPQQGQPPHQPRAFLFSSQESQTSASGKVSKGNIFTGISFCEEISSD